MVCKRLSVIMATGSFSTPSYCSHGDILRFIKFLLLHRPFPLSPLTDNSQSHNTARAKLINGNMRFGAELEVRPATEAAEVRPPRPSSWGDYTPGSEEHGPRF